MSEGLFFHAGCPVCASAAMQSVRSLDPARYEVKVGQPLDISFGAVLADLA